MQQGAGFDPEDLRPPPDAGFDAGPDVFSPPPEHPRPPSPEGLLRDGHVWVLDADRQQVSGPPFPLRDASEGNLRPIVWGGATVGWLGFKPHPHAQPFRDDRLQAAFIEQQARTGYVIMALALLISLVGSLILARQFLLPIKRLAADFNLLARTLAHNEQCRRQWVADTSHELRTPLAVLRSEVEALLDGVREPTPERLRSLHGEIMALSKLVDDLFELSLYDLGNLKYRMEPLNPVGIPAEVVSGFRSRFEAKNIALKPLNQHIAKITVLGDAQRLRQLFGNLLENRLRYTDAGGACKIAVRQAETMAILEVSDSAPAVPESACTQLFERFYRVDSSRSRRLGGAGLGLAICRNIVEAHGGGIRAQVSHLGGLSVRVELPLLPS